LPIELCQHEELFDASQHWPETGISVLGTSILLPSGWRELSRIFRVHYGSDLSFVHLPTLVGPYISAAHQDWNEETEELALESKRASPLAPSGLILAFLALTLRHCRSKIREYLVPRAHDLDNAAALSAYFAILAKRCLTSDADWSRSDVEGVQVRLMLASYDWSLGRSQQARQLLSEGISLASDIGLLQDYRAKHGSSSISVAMAFEAESMGIQMRSTVGHGDSPDCGSHAEAVRRTAWSLFLLDTEYALGDHRSKLICNTDGFPPLPNSEASFVGNVLTMTPPGDEQLVGWQRQPVPEPLDTYLQTDMCYFAPTSTGFWPALTPSISSTSSNSLPELAGDQILSYYIRYVSLFHRIHAWAHSKPWRCVCPIPKADLR
jgi:hypothetical protein